MANSASLPRISLVDWRLNSLRTAYCAFAISRTFIEVWEKLHILASMVAPRNVPIHPLADYGPEMSAGQQFFVGRFEHSITSRPNRLRFHRHSYYEVFW